MRYLISYELNTPGRDYLTLWNALAGLNAKRVLYSQYVLRRYDTTAARLRDQLWTFMDAGDTLLIVCLDNTDWAEMNPMVDLNAV
jgi:hypothetical protein